MECRGLALAFTLLILVHLDISQTQMRRAAKTSNPPLKDTARYKLIPYSEEYAGHTSYARPEPGLRPSITNGIYGGKKTLRKIYPHMALMGYADSDRFLNNDVEWNCGGSLISENFVLSAAHCSRHAQFGAPKWALLGVVKISDVDGAMRAVYNIVRKYDHPNYNPKTMDHDITLYQLNTTVKLSPYVQPACLYTSTFKPVYIRGIITGWGITGAAEQKSDFLLKATIWIVQDSLCSNRFENYNTTNKICAGDIEAGRDTCQGDSGGPLQVSNEKTCMWDIIGVTSYGPGICGNHEDYAVYTYVAVYWDWIKQIVWP